jgi:hypothetical protein
MHPLAAQLAADARSVQLRFSNVSCVIRKRLGASDAAPSSLISLPARSAAPRPAPRHPPPPLQPRAHPPQHRSTQRNPCTAGVRKHMLTAQLAADACSVLPRSSDVSCANLSRLGASDATPAAPIRLSAPSRNPANSYSPARNRPSPQHAASSMHSRRSHAPAHSAAGRRSDARSLPWRSSDVSCVILTRLGASDAAPSRPIPFSARSATPRLAQARQTPPPTTAPHATAPACSTQHHPCTAGVRMHPLTAQLPPINAAYHRGPATSAAPNLRGSVPATLPQLLRSHCLHMHRRPSARPSQTPPSATAPRASNPSPQHALSSMHSRRSQAPAHSAAGCKCKQRTKEVQRRQLRHPFETRCQRRCPISSDPIVCTYHRPSARRLQSPPSATARAHPPQPTRTHK